MRPRSELWRRLLRNRPAALGGACVLAVLLIAVAAPLLAPHDPAAADLSRRLLPPRWAGGRWEHPLGCDQHGRDVFSRLIFGARASLLISLLVVAGSTIIGTACGLLAGYYGGRWDRCLSWTVDTLLAFPYLVFAIGLMAALGTGLANLVVTLTVKSWVPFCRLARGDTLVMRSREFVLAARALGAGDGHILFREILPNLLPSVWVLATLNLATVMIMEASLSFLGLGVQPPTPTWGGMIAEGRDYLLEQWWLSTLPGLCISAVVMAMNLFGEGLRDVLDPRIRE